MISPTCPPQYGDLLLQQRHRISVNEPREEYYLVREIVKYIHNKVLLLFFLIGFKEKHISFGLQRDQSEGWREEGTISLGNNGNDGMKH